MTAMTDPRLTINETPRIIPPDRDLDTTIFSLVWQAIQRWSETQQQLRKELKAALANENQAWIALADECFQLRQANGGEVGENSEQAPTDLTRAHPNPSSLGDNAIGLSRHSGMDRRNPDDRDEKPSIGIHNRSIAYASDSLPSMDAGFRHPCRNDGNFSFRRDLHS